MVGQIFGYLFAFAFIFGCGFVIGRCTKQEDEYERGYFFGKCDGIKEENKRLIKDGR